jgi:hypothetical protein
MSPRQAAWCWPLVLLLGCAPGRFELYDRLSDGDKELYDLSRQFMTDRQQERFLRCPDSDCRVRLIEALHIQDRLAKFPPYVREAILAQRVVPGMSTEALLLTWGRPGEIERRQIDGVEIECWYFKRGNRDGRVVQKKVFVMRGLVTEVAE